MNLHKVEQVRLNLNLAFETAMDELLRSTKFEANSLKLRLLNVDYFADRMEYNCTVYFEWRVV